MSDSSSTFGPPRHPLGSRLRATAGRIGLLCHLPALLAVPCLIVALTQGENAGGFACAAGVSLAVGQLGFWIGRGAEAEADGAHTVAGGWLLIAALSAIPFGFAEPSTGYATWLDALFEGMSGCTSTGLSRATDPSTLPRGIQLWRSVLEWVGGLGFVVLTLALVRPTEEGRELYVAEARAARFGTARDTARRMLGLYALFTVAAIAGLWLTGVPMWAAVNHGLAGISTGGFTITDDSYVGYGAATKAWTIVVMIAGATSFALPLALFLNRDLEEAKARSVQFVWMLAVIVLGALALTVGGAAEGPVLDRVFEWVSGVTTTGFTTFPSAGGPFLMLLTLAMLVGGCAGSTAGGLKIERMRRAILATGRRLRDARFSRDSSEDDEQKDAAKPGAWISEARLFALGQVVLVGVTWWMGALLLGWTLGPDSVKGDVLFEAASAVGGVGLTRGISAAPDLPGAAKGLLVALMWVGRLEIVPVVVLLWRMGAGPVEHLRSSRGFSARSDSAG